TVLKVAGDATVTVGGATSPLKVGAKLSPGATITTGADSEVYLQAHTGTIATVKANSVVSIDELSVTREGGKVTKEKTAINLKSGNLVSALDPAKRAVNDYQVKTPKGVAAARGTTFTVSYNGVNYTIVATSGSVQITAGDTVVNIAGGQASVSNVNGGAATAVASLPAEQKAEAIQAMAVAVATIAVALENNMLGASGAAELQDAVRTVITAAPEAARDVAALVAASAPSQTDVVVDTVRDVAPQQSGAVQQAIRDVDPPSRAPDSTPSQTPRNDATTPQPIEPGVISRSQ
ncbi:MAG TPA: FecR domain-containing protein, partial [Opitutaceae bacterium]|nr:FecR domain-containing protein [Opitutaceae bacterium]